MSDFNSPPVLDVSASLTPVRVAVSRPQLRRSVSANVLSGDHVQVQNRLASAVTPVSNPASSPRAVEPTQTRPRTRYYAMQEAELLAASRDIASLSRAVLGNRAPEQSTPVAGPTALADELSVLVNEDIDFHSPASSTIEASVPNNCGTANSTDTESVWSISDPGTCTEHPCGGIVATKNLC
jgi:hypothetical protein